MNISCFASYVLSQEALDYPSDGNNMLACLRWGPTSEKTLWMVRATAPKWEKCFPSYVQLELIYDGGIVQKGPQKEQLSRRGERETFAGLATGMDGRLDLLALAILDGRITEVLNHVSKRLHFLSLQLLNEPNFTHAAYQAGVAELVAESSISMGALNG